MSALYPSTKALSAYNMLSVSRRDLTVAEVVDGLRRHFDPSIDEDWVREGVSFLVERGFVLEQDGKLVPARPRAPDGKIWPLVRSEQDTALEWA